MKFAKKVLDSMERVYATSYTVIKKEIVPLFASEAVNGSCYAYIKGEKKVVWEGRGGTMSLVEIANKNGDFLATTGFYPGFDAHLSKVVYVSYKNEKFHIRDVISLPYLHRFDCIYSGSKYYFVGATLCKSKSSREDWSNPGDVYVGEFNSDFTEVLNLRVLIPNLTKNHGYHRFKDDKGIYSFITSEDGVFKINIPNETNKEFSYDKISDKPTSDIAVIDIDRDSNLEYLTISPFHGNKLSISRLVNNKLEEIYERKIETDFIHAIASGVINKERVFVVGARRFDKDLFILTYNSLTKTFEEERIDQNTGPSNVTVINYPDKDVILSANNGIGEVAVYTYLDE
ncbi:MAG: hypothetical protein LBV58_01345 [Acholeplasmatales bacterium]|jgi:hypothetical protein|nr:hypothetical protein [Acholeplasmatales bacterium]